MNDADQPPRYDGAQSTVTMNRPLEPWGHTRFHKALAVHIHDATRFAGHGHEAPNYGIMESENDARKWDIPHVPADHARQVMKEATK